MRPVRLWLGARPTSRLGRRRKPATDGDHDDSGNDDNDHYDDHNNSPGLYTTVAQGDPPCRVGAPLHTAGERPAGNEYAFGRPPDAHVEESSSFDNGPGRRRESCIRRRER